MEEKIIEAFDKIMSLKEEFTIAIDIINKSIEKDKANRSDILDSLRNSTAEENSPIILEMIVERDIKMTEVSIIYNELNVRFNAFLDLETGMDFEPSFIKTLKDYEYLLAKRNFNLLEGKFTERETGFIDRVKALRKKEFVNDNYVEYLMTVLENE